MAPGRNSYRVRVPFFDGRQRRLAKARAPWTEERILGVVLLGVAAYAALAGFVIFLMWAA
jgi:hypothetical protein